MIYVSFMNNNRQSNGVLLASYKKQPYNEDYNLVIDIKAKSVVVVKNDDMILSALNLVAEWVSVPTIDIVVTDNNNAKVEQITDYNGYPFIAANSVFFVKYSNREYAINFLLENMPELQFILNRGN